MRVRISDAIQAEEPGRGRVSYAAPGQANSIAGRQVSLGVRVRVSVAIQAEEP